MKITSEDSNVCFWQEHGVLETDAHFSKHGKVWLIIKLQVMRP